MEEKNLPVVDNLYIRLTEYIYNCSKLNTDFYIAKSMLANLVCFPDMTIQEVAKESFSSTTSVTKFCHKLGYQNFYELRHAIEQPQPENTIFQNSLKKMKTSDDLKIGLTDFIEETKKLDERIFDSFDYEQVERICQQILAADSVALIVPMFTFESGNLLKELLHRLGINVFMINRSADQPVIVEMIANVDLSIVISMTGKWLNRETQRMLSQLEKDIIFLTSNLNANINQQEALFKEIVQLNRLGIKRSSYVSSRLYANYFIAIFYQLEKSLSKDL